MKKYMIVCGLLFSFGAQAQISFDKLKNEVQKVEEKVVAPTTTTPTTTTSPGTTGTTTTATPKTTTTITNPLSSAVSGLQEGEVVDGLKEALTKGAMTASQSLNKTDGFYKNPKVKIPVPEEAEQVVKTLREFGYGKKVDEFELTLNRAGEQAAKEAAPIFKKAITGMSFSDAKQILVGSDSAATHYLRKTTYASLYTSFTPHVQKAIGDNKVATKWNELTKLYNKLPITKSKVSTDLVSYTTTKALKGLFTLVADEEKSIRKNPVARTTDLMKKVFGSL